MRLSDQLRQQRAALVDRMEALSDAAAERTFDDAEAKQWDALMADVKKLDREIERQLAAEELKRNGNATGPRLITDRGEVVRALTKADKLADLLPRSGASQEPVRLGHLLRGVVLGDWGAANRVERAMGESPLASGGYAVDSSVASVWLDNARAASVCMSAGSITIPMPTASMTVVRIDGDATPAFKKEHSAFTESDLVFAGVQLKARTVGILCRVSAELLEDSPIANQAIEQSLFATMGLAFDAAMLAGDGDQTGTKDNPTGLTHAAGVLTQPATAPLADYDSFIDGYIKVANANGTPNALVWNPTTLGLAAKLKTGLSGDRTQLEIPQPIDTLPRFLTTTLPANGGTGGDESTAIVGDFGMLGLALRSNLIFEATRVASDAFQNFEVLVRIVARVDVAVLRPNHFCLITGIK